MSRCPIFNFQLSIMTKWLDKHISTKLSFKITIRKDIFTLTYVDLEYETNISSWNIWNDDRTLPIDLLIFQLATSLYSQNTYETEIHNEICHINLYMNIDISNWHNWSYDPTKMNFVTLYKFFTQLLTSKHLKPIRP